MDAGVVIRQVRQETASPVVFPDFVCVLESETEPPATLHGELQLRYSAEEPAAMARYGGSLAWQYGRPVVSVLVLIRPDGVPDTIPEVGEYVIGGTRTLHSFKTVRLWESDPAVLLESGDARLFPWAVLMKSTDEQVRAMAKAVAVLGEEEITARFLTLGSLRYHRSYLEQILGRQTMAMTEVILQSSSIVREIAEEARAAGLAEGLSEGLVEGHVKGRVEGRVEGGALEARRILRRCLSRRLLVLAELPELEMLHDPAAMERILDLVLADPPDPALVRQSILQAAAETRA